MRHNRRILATLVACALLVLAGSSGAFPAGTLSGGPVTARSHSPRGPARASVVILQGAPTRPVPQSFLGISTEYWAIPLFDRHRGEFERILRLVHPAGTGPLSLRVGGDSTDHAFLDPDFAHSPAAIFELDRDWFHQMTSLVKRVRARLILDLNLVIDLPRMAAAWAEAALAGLPRGAVSGFEVGNEPDLYRHRYWLSAFREVAPLARDLPVGVTPRRYVELFRSYGQALSRVAPGAGLFGPVVGYPIEHHQWISALLEGPHPGLRMITAHEYPYSGCTKLQPRAAPTVAKLLSDRSTAGVAARLGPSIDLAHRAGFRFRLTELNSVTCGGTNGLSNTFVTALWAPDMLFELLRAGVDGVNIHVRPHTVNAAFALTPHGIAARPLLYGLVTFARMLGPETRLVALRLRTEGAAHVKAWATEVAGDRLHVLLVNKGETAVAARLALPATGLASVQRLLAPSVTARSHVTLGGQHLGPDEQWQGHESTQHLGPVHTQYELSLPATSAALLTVRLDPNPSRGPSR